MRELRTSYWLFQESCTKKICEYCEFIKCFAILIYVRKGLVANLVLFFERSEKR
jgi:hypothetical protein